MSNKRYISYDNRYEEGSDLWKKQEEVNKKLKDAGRYGRKLTPQEISNFSGAGKITTGADGLQHVEGGQNMYGFNRADQTLLRDANNNVAEPFREKVGDSVNQLKAYGQGSGIDEQAKVGMGDAYSKLSQQAMGSGDLESIALGRQKLTNQSNTDMDRLNRQAQGNVNSSLSAMAMRGGVGGGSAERMLKSAGRNAMAGQQDIMAQNRNANLDLSIQNSNQRNSLLQDVGRVQNDQNQYNANAFTNDKNRRLDALTKAGQVEQDVQSSNINAARQDVDKTNLMQTGLYSEDMSAWAAMKSAAASKPSSGGGGCCFIFLEARYGNGAMDNVVRRFRDENMTTQNKRGYYKLSEVLVPLMRKYKAVKLATRLLMTDPMVSYGKAHYGENKIGYIFKPVVKFWLGMFDYLGGSHEFIRENGETV